MTSFAREFLRPLPSSTSSYMKLKSASLIALIRRFLGVVVHGKRLGCFLWLFTLVRRLSSLPQLLIRTLYKKFSYAREPTEEWTSTTPSISKDVVPQLLQHRNFDDHPEYTMVQGGESMSLEGVARSQVYSLADSGLRNQARASDIQLATISQHERLVSESRKGTPAPSIHRSIRPRFEDDNSLRSGIPPFMPPRTATPASMWDSPLVASAPLEVDEFDISLKWLEGLHTMSSETTAPRTWPIESIVPDIPESMSGVRYSERPIIKQEFQPLIVDPLDTSFDSHPAPNGWVRHAHPEGARYFSRQNVLTDSDLTDPGILRSVIDDVYLLLVTYQQRGILPNPRWHLVISTSYLNRLNGSTRSFYYFVDHEARKLFFLDPFKGENLGSVWGEAKGCNSLNHLGYEFEAQYWLFVSLFPTCRRLTKNLTLELRDITLYCIGDNVFSTTALAPYSLDTLERILNWSKSMDYNIDRLVPATGTLTLLARFLFAFYHNRFLHFHGEGHARLERHKSVYGYSTNHRTLLITVVSPFLFSAPDVQLRHLQKMWVDGIMHKSIWEDSVKRMNAEWQDHVLIGTVLLNANMGFLAIGIVDQNRLVFRSAAQISSYLSIVASIGSILLALLLLRQNNTKLKETANDVQNFLNQRNHKMLGLERLAILYSLPYALLMWSVVAFLVAFSVHCFWSTSAATRSVVASMAGGVAGLIFWCIYQAWESHETDNGIQQSATTTQNTPGSSNIPLLQPSSAHTPIPHNGSPTEISFSFRRPTLDTRLGV